MVLGVLTQYKNEWAEGGGVEPEPRMELYYVRIYLCVLPPLALISVAMATGLLLQRIYSIFPAFSVVIK